MKPKTLLIMRKKNELQKNQETKESNLDVKSNYGKIARDSTNPIIEVVLQHSSIVVVSAVGLGRTG